MFNRFVIALLSLFLLMAMSCSKKDENAGTSSIRKSDATLESNKNKNTKNPPTTNDGTQSGAMKNTNEFDVSANKPKDATEAEAPEPESQKFTVSGTIVGLKGSGLVIKISKEVQASDNAPSENEKNPEADEQKDKQDNVENDDKDNKDENQFEKEKETTSQELQIASGSSEFIFEDVKFKDKEKYALQVITQPADPEQTCNISAPTGSIANADIENIAIECEEALHTIKLSVKGLPQGESINLNLNEIDSLSITENKDVAFAKKVGAKFKYSVKISSNATTAYCQVESGDGILEEEDIILNVTCKPAFAIKPSVSGLPAGTFVTFKLTTGENELASTASAKVGADGLVEFKNVRLPAGTKYTLAVAEHPEAASCAIESASGTMPEAEVSIPVSCREGGILRIFADVKGLEGSGLILETTRTSGLQRPKTYLNVAAVGKQEFPADFRTGDTYEVAILTQPLGGANPISCTIANEQKSGTIAQTDVTINVSCALNLADFGFTFRETSLTNPDSNTWKSTLTSSLPNKSFCPLTMVRMEEIDGPYGHCESRRVYKNNAGNLTGSATTDDLKVSSEGWYLFAALGDDSDSEAICTSNCINWSQGAFNIKTKSNSDGKLERTSAKEDTANLESIKELGPAQNTACALSYVQMGDLDDVGESATCATYIEDDKWKIKAAVGKKQQVFAHCNAHCLSWPQAANFSLGSEKSMSRNNSGGEGLMTLVDASEANKYFCFLTSVSFEDLDGGGEHATCNVYKDGGNNWVLKAALGPTGDADASCKARCLKIAP